MGFTSWQEQFRVKTPSCERQAVQSKSIQRNNSAQSAQFSSGRTVCLFTSETRSSAGRETRPSDYEVQYPGSQGPERQTDRTTFLIQILVYKGQILCVPVHQRSTSSSYCFYCFFFSVNKLWKLDARPVIRSCRCSILYPYVTSMQYLRQCKGMWCWCSILYLYVTSVQYFVHKCDINAVFSNCTWHRCSILYLYVMTMQYFFCTWQQCSIFLVHDNDAVFSTCTWGCGESTCAQPGWWRSVCFSSLLLCCQTSEKKQPIRSLLSDEVTASDVH